MECHQSAVLSLVVCSQKTAKRLSLLVSHKQRAVFYLNGLSGGKHHRGGKVNLLSGGPRCQRVTLSPFGHECIHQCVCMCVCVCVCVCVCTPTGVIQ